MLHTDIVRTLIAVLVASGLAGRASAFCMYNDEMYAKTTLEQEFSDSTYVVRARPSSEINRTVNGRWTISRLEILEVFKGDPPPRLAHFTERNSGGFYIDVGIEYLLFLNPDYPPDPMPKAADGLNFTFVNYACGQSKEWSEVTPEERLKLKSISTKSP